MASCQLMPLSTWTMCSSVVATPVACFLRNVYSFTRFTFSPAVPRSANTHIEKLLNHTNGIPLNLCISNHHHCWHTHSPTITYQGCPCQNGQTSWPARWWHLVCQWSTWTACSAGPLACPGSWQQSPIVSRSVVASRHSHTAVPPIKLTCLGTCSCCCSLCPASVHLACSHCYISAPRRPARLPHLKQSPVYETTFIQFKLFYYKCQSLTASSSW